MENRHRERKEDRCLTNNLARTLVYLLTSKNLFLHRTCEPLCSQDLSHPTRALAIKQRLRRLAKNRSTGVKMECWANLETAANAATVIATIFAASGLFFNAFSIRGQAKSTDLNSLFQLAKEIRDAEERLLSATNEEIKLREINNYLNILEVFAASVNNDLFGKITQRMAAERPIDDISILMEEEYTRQKIQDAVTSESTFQELSRFAKKIAA